jgi:TrmH family RNA methyltransferase
VQRLRRLAHRRAERAEASAFVIDGPTLVGAALDAGLPVDEVFVEDGAPVADLDAVARRAEHAGAVVRRVQPGVLARATGTVTPQGMAAVAPLPVVPLDEVVDEELVLVLAGVGDPGNAGTLVRTAEAAGVGAVVFCDGSVDPFAPKTVRSSAGSLFHVKVASGGNPVHVLERLGTGGRRRLGTSAHAGVDYDRLDLTGPLAIALGNEAHGLADDVAAHVDAWARVPMAGRVESLNVAMAGTVICFEAARQRRRAPRRAPR